MVAAGGTLGAFFATVIGFIFVLPSLPTWTWRIPFFIGALIGLVGFYMRHELKESPKLIEEKSTLKKILLLSFLNIISKRFCVLLEWELWEQFLSTLL